MSVTVSVNGASHQIAATSDENWGTYMSNTINVCTQALFRNTQTFTLTNDVNFGSSKGLIAGYFKSSGANIATAGVVRLNATDAICWGSTQNYTLNVMSNTLSFNGSSVLTAAGTLTASNAVVTDGSGSLITHPNVTVTELSYLNGVTAGIQGQIDAVNTAWNAADTAINTAWQAADTAINTAWGAADTAINTAWQDIVAVQYHSNAANQINGETNEILDFENKVYDTHDAVTTGAAWKFTAPRTGYYSVKFISTYAGSTWAEGEAVVVKALVDNSVARVLHNFEIENTGSFQIAVKGSCDLALTANQELQLNIYSSNNQNKVLDSDPYGNMIEIHKIGA